MTRFVLECWLLLFHADTIMRFHGFKHLHGAVREEPVRSKKSNRTPYEQLSRAMDVACVFYFKPVLCLQRSAATAILMRRYGWKAQMVLGAQMLPFLSHAWVEIDGVVVNDKPYVTEAFQVLERC